MRTGGQIVVDHLVSQGVRHLFMVPGESFLGILDALHDDTRIEPVTARNEAGAAMMAEATGKLTGRPGVALVTRGPGAANAMAGVYVAAQDQTPLVLLVGLPARKHKGLPAFQKIDLARTFGALAKNVSIAETAAALPQHLAFAFRLAMSGRPGPVVLGVPEDVLFENARQPANTMSQLEAPKPTPEHLAALNTLLARADRPLVISGAPLWSKQAAQDLKTFAERYGLPVAAAFRRQDRLDNTHPLYAGHLGFNPDARLAAAVREADVLIVLGQCLNEVTTSGFSLVKDNEAQKIILIAPDAETPDAPYVPDLAIPACPMRALEALAVMPTPGKTPPWSKWRTGLRSAYEASLAGADSASPLRLDLIMDELARALPDGAIVCSGAGAYAAALHRHYVYRGFPSQLAPNSGSMGYGLPAAIAAKLAHPELPVIAFAGDGCLQMTLQEIATAVQLDLPIVIVVVNNGVLGTIQNAQTARANPKVIATTLVNPDFAVLARAYGALGARITQTSQFAPLLKQALAANQPALIELDMTAHGTES
jgi:acetolactate synthase-1/2/3 large subunit